MFTKKIAELESGFNLYEIKVPDGKEKIDFYVQCSDSPIYSTESFIQFFEVAKDENEALIQLQDKWERLQTEIFGRVKDTLKVSEQQMTEIFFKLKN